MTEELVAEAPVIKALVIVVDTIVVETVKGAPFPQSIAPDQMLGVVATALVLLVLNGFWAEQGLQSHCPAVPVP